jgi:hypothetical protein
MSQRRVSDAERIAFLIGFDLAEMSEYRYQSTRYRVAVYAIGERYFCVPRGRKLPDVGGAWRVHGEAYGQTVMVCDMIKG